MDRTFQLYCLANECPFGDECKDCPIQEIRNLHDLEKQMEIIDKMSIAEMDNLLDWHNEKRVQREEEFKTKRYEQFNLLPKKD